MRYKLNVALIFAEFVSEVLVIQRGYVYGP